MGNDSDQNQTKELQNYIYTKIVFYIQTIFLMTILCCFMTIKQKFTPGHIILMQKW